MEKEIQSAVKSHLPKGEDISYHTAEVLRQAENANVVEGGWVGGDAWFGSIESCVELMRVLKLHSTFIVKQNLNYYPMKVLHAILCARHGSRPAGHWVVMQAVIGGVDLYIMAYARSSKGVASMVSSCGKTVMHVDPYIFRFEDEYGNVQEKELPHPTVAHMLYEFLPLIDEHNKARQNALALEKHWLTKNCWTRILTTFLGMSVVDLQRWDRRMRFGHVSSIDLSMEVVGLENEYDDELVDDFDIKTMANLIGRPLTDGQFRYRAGCQPSTRATTSLETNAKPSVQITGPDGSIHYPKEPGKRPRVRQQSCYVCRQYSDKFFNTQWKCRECGMPLCQVSRVDTNAGRQYSCIVEHKLSGNKFIGCGKIPHRTHFILPDEMKKFIQTRSQLQRREERLNKKRKSRENQREAARTELVEAVLRGAVREVSDTNPSNTRAKRSANIPRRSKRTRRS